jgi:hypothetical protein
MIAAAKRTSEIIQFARFVVSCFNSQVKASRTQNKELGEAATLMQYIIGLIGWVTRTPDCKFLPTPVGRQWRLMADVVTRSILVCVAFTAGAVCLALWFDHAM